MSATTKPTGRRYRIGDTHLSGVDLRGADLRPTMTPSASDRAEADARAHVQQSLATAIRSITPEAAHETSSVVQEHALTLVHSPRGWLMLAALAAAAHDDALWDALAQVRQAIVLERGRPR